MVNGAYERARSLLDDHRPQLQALAQALLDKETLDSQEIDTLLAAPPPPPETPAGDDSPLPLQVRQA
jgi:ATP-dependent Zn protease